MALLELGETNGNLEMIRLNKKFDIFLRRFMKMEEDIKEIKNNFFRVMHCAFAKYEEGFKRKNEYLERRRAKKRQEIEIGVTKELEKRKIEQLANQAVNNGSSSDEDFEIDPKNTNIDERKFMRTMQRQGMNEEDDMEEKEDKKKDILKAKTQEVKKKLFI